MVFWNSAGFRDCVLVVSLLGRIRGFCGSGYGVCLRFVGVFSL